MMFYTSYKAYLFYYRFIYQTYNKAHCDHIQSILQHELNIKYNIVKQQQKQCTTLKK